MIHYTTQAAAIVKKLKENKVKNRYAAKAKVKKIRKNIAWDNWLAK